uniref:Uncharacterized protein n=1 Tax=Tanacetum cinerariifolium TaxID=118510 RepID=A0A699GNA1_TANCI|nr:hypothetical protein [Tanacetum cinerariifolium]
MKVTNIICYVESFPKSYHTQREATSLHVFEYSSTWGNERLMMFSKNILNLLCILSSDLLLPIIQVPTLLLPLMAIIFRVPLDTQILHPLLTSTPHGCLDQVTTQTRKHIYQMYISSHHIKETSAEAKEGSEGLSE